MVKDCGVFVDGGIDGIYIFKKRKGLFNKVYEKTKASVCPNCGYVAFYIDNYKEFK